MAESGKPMGKKGKKNKKFVMSLHEFIGSSNANAPVIQTTTSNWADEMADITFEDDQVDYRINREALPTAPKSVLKAALDEMSVPTVPPFTAFVSNLPFDVHLDDIKRFFKNLNIVEIRLQKDSSGRSRGFGHIDFETRDMLISAIGHNELYIKNRPIKVSLQQEREKRDHDYRRDREPENDKTQRDWRKKDPQQKEDDRNVDSGSYRSGGDRYGRQKEGSYDRQDRWRDNYNNKDRYSNNRDRYNQRDSQDRFSDNRYQPQNGRQNDNTEREWRRKSSRDEDSRDFSDRQRDRPRYTDARRDQRASVPTRVPSDLPPSDAPRERPKLNLKPRSKPLEGGTTALASSSIFGDAKPVDTTLKEREVEEKLRQKMADIKTKDVPSSEENYQQSTESSEDPKVIPAPPPKVNAWQTPRTQHSQPHKPQPFHSDTIMHPASYKNSATAGSDDRRDQHNKGRNQAQTTNSSHSSLSVNKKSEGGAWRARNKDAPVVQKAPAKARQAPQSYEDMPKMQQKTSKDWSDKNKFTSLLTDDPQEDQDVDNDKKHGDQNSHKEDAGNHQNDEDDDASWSRVRYSKAHERLEQ